MVVCEFWTCRILYFRTVANYLLWRFVRHRVSNLDDRFQEAKQQFYYILFGRKQAPPRWKNCVAEVNDYFDMALGAMFVSKYFDEKSKSDVSTFVHSNMRWILSLLSGDITYVFYKEPKFHTHTQNAHCSTKIFILPVFHFSYFYISVHTGTKSYMFNFHILMLNTECITSKKN